MSNSSGNLTEQNYTFDFEKYFDRGWEIFRQYLWGFIGFVIFNFVISIFLSGNAAAIINTFILSPILTAGYYIVAIRIAKNKSKNFRDFFTGFKQFLPFILVNIVSVFLIVLAFTLPLLLGTLISKILTGLGLIILVIPGIYLLVCYCLFPFLFVIEYRLGFWAALETSRKVISKKWFSFFVFSLVLFYINIVGILFLGIGLFFTIPLTYCSIVAAFEDAVGWKKSELSKQEV